LLCPFNKPKHFSMPVEEHFAAVSGMRACGIALIGHFHNQHIPPPTA
jgi:hypothetical protein